VVAGRATAARGRQRLEITRQPRAAAYIDKARRFFLKFFGTYFFYFFKALACCKGLGCFGGCIHSTPIFGSLSLHLEVLNLPSLMDFEDFIFFQILFLLN
jgi:hypothetical protein